MLSGVSTQSRIASQKNARPVGMQDDQAGGKKGLLFHDPSPLINSESRDFFDLVLLWFDMLVLPEGKTLKIGLAIMYGIVFDPYLVPADIIS